MNDLASVCGLKTTKEIEEYEREQNKKEVAEIKRYIREYELEGDLNITKLKSDYRFDEYNDNYDGIMKHFCKLYGKLKYLGKHAAGVAVVGSDISNYTCLIRKADMYSSCYDLNDLEHINCTKFDMLGLKTMSEIRELKEYTKHVVTEEEREDPVIYESFREGKTDGIFQMEKSAPKKILSMIECDCSEDVFAVNALNRPAPLQLKMHETYAYNKLSGNIDKTSPYYKYTKETYGTMLYQEQTIEVAQRIGHLSSEQTFNLLSIMKKEENQYKDEYIQILKQMQKDFMNGCKKERLTKEQAKEIWASMLIYGFNKGHSTGYSLISIDQMYYKINHPAEFWYVKMKYAANESDIYKYSIMAVKDNAVVMLPHVNYSAKTSMRKFDSENVIQQGLTIIKGIGEKVAEVIEQERIEHGAYKSFDDFYDRCKGRAVTSKVIDILENQSSALVFNKQRYLNMVIKYNSSLLGR